MTGREPTPEQERAFDELVALGQEIEPVVPEWAVEKAAAAIHANECSHEHHVFTCPSARMFERAATLALDAVLPHFTLREDSPHA